MENIGLRTPHILVQINDLIDNKSLMKCKEASRIMCSIIENLKCGKFLTMRRIQCYLKKPVEFEKDWRVIFEKLPAERLSEFGILVKEFYTTFTPRFEENWAPMHIVAERGHLDFCKFIAKVSVAKSFKFPPLLFSAQAGHLEVSKYLFTEIDNKTPSTGPSQITAQHLAAKNGHLEMFKFLHENLNDVNPIMQEHITPLHLAAQCGHFDVCKYICDNTVMVAPFRSDFLTPYNLAKYRGHFKVANLLNERDTTLNIIGNVPNTFLIFLILVYIFIFICLFFGLDLLQYQFSGVSRTFNRPIKSNVQDFLIIFLCFPKLAVLLIDTVKNVRFSFWTSPKLDY